MKVYVLIRNSWADYITQTAVIDVYASENVARANAAELNDGLGDLQRQYSVYEVEEYDVV